jgi:hypothetical protein
LKLPVNPKEPMQKRLYLAAMKRAAVLLWGDEGLNDIARGLPDDTREEFFRVVQTDPWIAARHYIKWMYVAHEGPARLSLPKTREYIDRIFDFSSGIVLRSMLRMADPVAITLRLGSMWKEENTHGELAASVDDGGRSATLRLSGSPYTETPQTRGGIVEQYRYAFSMTRAKDVTATHALEKPSTLVCRIRWT